jgi:type I restriction enzyme, S subunit
MTSRLDASYAVVRKTGVPAGWQEKQVADLVRIVGGGTPDRGDSANWRDGGIPWITPTDLTANNGKYIYEGAENISEAGLANSNAQRVPAGSIIFSTRGTVGNLAIAGVPLTTNQSCEVLVPRDDINSEFLYYLLNYGMFAFHRLAGGTTFGAITRREIGRVWLAIPDGDEQTTIARVLSAVDTAIKRAKDAVVDTRKVRRSLIQNFFYSALGITAYADHPSQKLPDGWKLIPTGSLLAEEPKNGISPQATAQPPGTPTFSIAAVRDGRVDLKNASNLKYAKVSERIAEKFAIRTGDLLVVRGNANPNLVGKAGRVAEFPDGCMYPDITKRILFRSDGEDTVTPEYAVLAWNHPIVHNQVLRRAKTSNGTLKINNRDVKQIVMPVPPPSHQRRIVELVEALDAESDALRQKLRSLEQLKKSLMHDLFTGTVRVTSTQ